MRLKGCRKIHSVWLNLMFDRRLHTISNYNVEFYYISWMCSDTIFLTPIYLFVNPTNQNNTAPPIAILKMAQKKSPITHRFRPMATPRILRFPLPICALYWKHLLYRCRYWWVPDECQWLLVRRWLLVSWLYLSGGVCAVFADGDCAQFRKRIILIV